MAEYAATHNIPYSEFLFRLLEAEVVEKQERSIQTLIKLSKLPYHKTIETFDFAAPFASLTLIIQTTSHFHHLMLPQKRHGGSNIEWKICIASLAPKIKVKGINNEFCSALKLFFYFVKLFIEGAQKYFNNGRKTSFTV